MSTPLTFKMTETQAEIHNRPKWVEILPVISVEFFTQRLYSPSSGGEQQQKQMGKEATKT